MVKIMVHSAIISTFNDYYEFVFLLFWQRIEGLGSRFWPDLWRYLGCEGCPAEAKQIMVTCLLKLFLR